MALLNETNIKTLPRSLREVMKKGENDLVLFTNELLGLPLHPGQIQYLEEAHAKINTLVPSNRWGKTTIDAILHIHANFYKKGLPKGNRAAWLGAAYRTANTAPAASLTEP